MAMASIPPSYYNASAAIPAANHSDFFNTHISYLSCGLSMLTSDETTLVIEGTPFTARFSMTAEPLPVSE
jgi:hypothetical protein